MKQSKGYFFRNGKPMHRLSYCAFLDVLGFSERVRESYKSGREDLLLESFHQALANRIDELKESANLSMLYFKSFTDNVVLVHPQCSEDMESEFGAIIGTIAELQLQMALEGFFVRGGLAINKLFMDENSVYGIALLEAYELESKRAINPIVVMCDDTRQLVDKHVKHYSENAAPQYRDVLKEQNGRYFLNYLSECIIAGDDREYLDVDLLRQHKDQVELALQANAGVPRVFSKFSWLAAYHNYFCDMVSNFPEYSNTLMVSTGLAAISFDRIQ